MQKEGNCINVGLLIVWQVDCGNYLQLEYNCYTLFQTITKYEAHPQSKFPWGRIQKQNTIAWKYLLQQIQQVFSSFSTYSPP
jgi:hypothetical protein